jgi:hypothetical protein
MQRYVWERAWRTRGEMKRLGYLRGEIEAGDDTARVRAAASPDDILIVKAGGDSGIYSTVIKIYVGMPATTVAVRGPGARRPEGRPT